MLEIPEIGAVYLLYLQFEDNNTSGKTRPVVILDKDHTTREILVLAMEATSKTPKSPPTKYDQLKIPIIDWKQAGFNKFSYGKVDKTAIFNKDVFLNIKPIGHVSERDLENIKYSLMLYQRYQQSNLRGDPL